MRILAAMRMFGVSAEDPHRSEDPRQPATYGESRS